MEGLPSGLGPPVWTGCLPGAGALHLGWGYPVWAGASHLGGGASRLWAESLSSRWSGLSSGLGASHLGEGLLYGRVILRQLPPVAPAGCLGNVKTGQGKGDSVNEDMGPGEKWVGQNICLAHPLQKVGGHWPTRPPLFLRL